MQRVGTRHRPGDAAPETPAAREAPLSLSDLATPAVHGSAPVAGSSVPGAHAGAPGYHAVGGSFFGAAAPAQSAASEGKYLQQFFYGEATQQMEQQQGAGAGGMRQHMHTPAASAAGPHQISDFNAYNDDDAPPAESLLDTAVQPRPILAATTTTPAFDASQGAGGGFASRSLVSTMRAQTGSRYGGVADVERFAVSGFTPAPPRSFGAAAAATDPFAGSSAAGTCVTVFGHPHSASSVALSLFRLHGAVVGYAVPSPTANFLVIRYATAEEARRALTWNGRVLSASGGEGSAFLGGAAAGGLRWMAGVLAGARDADGQEAPEDAVVAVAHKETALVARPASSRGATPAARPGLLGQAFESAWAW